MGEFLSIIGLIIGKSLHDLCVCFIHYIEAIHIKLCLFEKVLIDYYWHLLDQLSAKHGLTTIKGCILVRPWQNLVKYKTSFMKWYNIMGWGLVYNSNEFTDNYYA